LDDQPINVTYDYKPVTDLIADPLVVRAAAVGAFGGVGLALTSIYSRRGPLIFPGYAALLVVLALLLAIIREL
jgi:hypothetical protein